MENVVFNKVLELWWMLGGIGGYWLQVSHESFRGRSYGLETMVDIVLNSMEIDINFHSFGFSIFINYYT